MNWINNSLHSLDQISVTTINQAIEAESASVNAIMLVGGKDIAVGIVSKIITDVAKFLNVGKNIEPLQIRETAILIINDHVLKNLKPEDFKVISDNTKKGLYGPMYDRFDGQIYLANCYKYANERQDIIESKNIQKANEQKIEKFTPEIIESLSKIKTQIPNEERRSFTKDLTKPTFKEQDEKTKLVNQFFKEFDELYRTLPFKTKNPSDKFISYQGKVVDQIEYAKIKLEEYDRAI
jgi:hypothetical protein